MEYLIDGYNLFFKMESATNPLEKKRENFIQALNAALKHLNLHAILIFDSHQEHASFFPSKRVLSSIEIVFSPENLCADAYILERLRATKYPSRLIVVTSDKALSSQAKHLGAKTQSVEAFFKMLLHRQEKNEQKKEEKLEAESSFHFHRLLNAFEKRLEDDSTD